MKKSFIISGGQVSLPDHRRVVGSVEGATIISVEGAYVSIVGGNGTAISVEGEAYAAIATVLGAITSSLIVGRGTKKSAKYSLWD